MKSAPETLTAAQRSLLMRRLHALVKHLEGNATAAVREVRGEDARLTGELAGTGDAALAESELERDLATVGNANEALAQARDALARMDAGSYGRCEACDEPIGFERLAAQPAATRCIACQGAEEKREAQRR
jgi:DnaK suppressor protein